MNRSHWVRVFKIPYRREGKTLVREPDVRCETVKNALHKPGERTHLATDTHLTVHLVTPYFEEPRTEEEKALVDLLYTECEQEADKYLRAVYPDLHIS